MKRISFVFLLMPIFAMAQKSKTSNPTKKDKIAAQTKKTPPTKSTNDVAVEKTVNGFTINGLFTGFADGTTVNLLNPQTGATELQTTIKNNQFILKGVMPYTDLRVLVFNNQPPYLNLFLDNHSITVSGDKQNIEAAIIIGSPSHNDFLTFNRLTASYQDIFSESADYDSLRFDNVGTICYNYATHHSTSLMGTVALLRYFQVSEDVNKSEQVYNAMSPELKSHPLSTYITSQLSEAKNVPVGQPMQDFTQADTAGKPVSLSSFKGKFILIDFWASWCGPCRRENPNVVKAFNTYRDKNFTILGVSLDKAKHSWIDAIQMDGLNWTQVSDLGFWNNAVAVQFGIRSIPQNYLIDPEGKIVGVNLRGAALQKKLARLLR